MVAYLRKDVLVLELLAVRRDYHQQEAGTALVWWGTNAADKLGVDVSLRPLYRIFR